MRYIVRKALISMLTGASYMLGSWMAKEVLHASKDLLTKQKNAEENSPA